MAATEPAVRVSVGGEEGSAMFFHGWYDVLRVLVTGVVAYVALIVILRVSGKRTLSKMNAFDFIITVALGSSFATVLLSSQVSVVEGVVSFAVLAGLQYAVAWASVRSDRVQSLVKSAPTLVLYRGRYLDAALVRERVARSEVRAAAREQGYPKLEDVEAVVLETDGQLSVIGRLEGGEPDALVDVGGRSQESASAALTDALRQGEAKGPRV